LTPSLWRELAPGRVSINDNTSVRTLGSSQLKSAEISKTGTDEISIWSLIGERPGAQD
jgi:hypothetical protein